MEFNLSYVTNVLKRMKCDPVEIIAGFAISSEIEPDIRLRAAAKLFDFVAQKDDKGGKQLPLVLNFGNATVTTEVQADEANLAKIGRDSRSSDEFDF